jgi:hypothetical protein
MMFNIDQSIEDLKIRERNMFKVFFSMNNHQVATPEMMLEEARSYIIFFREAGNKISAYIGLHLLLTDRKLFYAYSSNSFPAEELEAVQDEALDFAESLGAMIDELHLTELSPQEVSQWIDRQDIFKSKSEPESVPETHEPGNLEPPIGHQELHASPGPSPVTEQAIPAQIPVQDQEQPQQASGVPAIPFPQQQARPPQEVTQASSAQPVSLPPLATAPDIQPPQQEQTAPSSTLLQQQVDSAAHAPQSLPALQRQPAPDARQESPEVKEGDELSSAHPQEHRPAEKKMDNRPHAQRIQGVDPEGKQAKPPSRAAGSKTPPAAPSVRQEPFQQVMKTGFVKGPKTPAKQASQTALGVVSREREALARLLTSF